MAMASVIDSEATFEQQASEAGLSQPWIDALKNNQMATMAKLSFAITTPGTAPTDDSITAFLGRVRAGVVPSIADLSSFKRIVFEAQTLMIHHLKSSIKGDEISVKRMAPPERDARLTQQRTLLRGLDINGPLEPAHLLYDLCSDMIEKNSFVYISPSKCLSRQQELAGSKPEKEIQLDASKSALVVKEQHSVQDIPISSDLALFQAIQRRSLAMDLTGLASYEVMKKWTDRLFSVYSQAVAPGFQKISQSQLLRADRQAFVRLGELFSGSLKQGAGPGKPLDPYIVQLENDVSVTYYMLPLPMSTNKTKGDDKGDKPPKKRQEHQQDSSASQVEKVKKAKGPGKGKNKREPALAECILESLAGEFKLANVQQFAKRLKLSHFSAIAASKQPSKPTSLALVPEFSHLVILSNFPSNISLPVDNKELRQCCEVDMCGQSYVVPCGCKLLRQTFKEGGISRLSKISVECTPSLHSIMDSDGQQNPVAASPPLGVFQCANTCGDSKKLIVTQSHTTGKCYDWVFGVRWTPEQFLQQACWVKHPFDSFSGLPTVVKNACEYVADMKPEDLINFRCSKLGSWLQLAGKLKFDEEKLKAGMTSTRKRILESKRLLLMKHIIEHEGYDDISLADDLISGFSLVGDVPKSNVLPPRMSPASMSTHDLQSNSQRANKALRFMTRSSGDPELDKKLWERTQIEIQRGWLVGPLNWDDLPAGAAVSRRFPLAQSEKVRPIDDFSQSQVNATVTSYEQATVDGPDVICGLAVHLMRSLRDRGRSSELLGRSLDLASAYRQLAVAESSYQFAYLSIYDPNSKAAVLCKQVALPFGSVTAVNAFIRCSRFLQWVAGHCLRIPMSSYFDDYVIFAPPELSTNTQAVLCLMLDIFGWAFDKEGPKSDSFSRQVTALGVVFKLDPTSDGRLEIHNTEKRLKESVAAIDKILASKSLGKRDALVLRGRLAFCDAFIFGRLGKISLQSITQHAYARPFDPLVADSLSRSLQVLRDRMADARPRHIDLNLSHTFVLFTDAAFNAADGAGLGAVLVGPNREVVAWFGLQLSLTQLQPLLVEDRQTVIGELETLAAAAALRVWCRTLASTKLLLFIDNEGARFSLIKGYSKAPAITSICGMASRVLDEFCIMPWYSRVPSFSNIADLPSRDVYTPLLPLNLRASYESVAKVVEESLESVGKPTGMMFSYYRSLWYFLHFVTLFISMAVVSALEMHVYLFAALDILSSCVDQCCIYLVTALFVFSLALFTRAYSLAAVPLKCSEFNWSADPWEGQEQEAEGARGWYNMAGSAHQADHNVDAGWVEDYPLRWPSDPRRRAINSSWNELRGSTWNTRETAYDSARRPLPPPPAPPQALGSDKGWREQTATDGNAARAPLPPPPAPPQAWWSDKGERGGCEGMCWWDSRGWSFGNEQQSSDDRGWRYSQDLGTWQEGGGYRGEYSSASDGALPPARASSSFEGQACWDGPGSSSASFDRTARQDETTFWEKGEAALDPKRTPVASQVEMKQEILRSVRDVVGGPVAEQTAEQLILAFCRKVGVEQSYLHVLSQAVFRFTGKFNCGFQQVAFTLGFHSIGVKGHYKKYVNSTSDFFLAHWSVASTPEKCPWKMHQSFYSVCTDCKSERGIFFLEGDELLGEPSFDDFITCAVHFHSTEDLKDSLLKHKVDRNIGVMADWPPSVQVFVIVIQQMCRILYPRMDINTDLTSIALSNPRKRKTRLVTT
eukprot:symbB.v1.2.014265.t1/scaffold1033.1/size247163/3